MISKRRNIGIMAHIDAGKTTTSERILFYTGKSHRIGDVDAGNTQLDWMEQEQERGITIQSAATTCNWHDYQINLIDTPGHVDFTAEVERSLRVLDGAIAVFCAVGGVQPQSETVWRQANKYNVPRLVYINKMDRTGANFEAVVKQISNSFEIPVIPIQIPIGMENSFEGSIDLLTMEELHYPEADQGSVVERKPIRESLKDEASLAREAMVDSLTAFSDELTELYLAGSDISIQLLKKTLREATIGLKAVAVLTGSSLKNKGVVPLLDAVIDYLPAPEEVAPIKAHYFKKDGELEIKRDDSEPLSALIFKIQQDKEMGYLCYVRVYSGILKSGVMLLNVAKDKKERSNRLLRMHAKGGDSVNEIKAGDIGVIIGLKLAQTGDTLTDEKRPVLLEKIDFPEPVISLAIEPKSSSDMDKLKEVMDFLTREDPTFTVKEDKETGQIIISGMGELHLDVLTTRARNDYKAQFNIGKPQVSYRESIMTEAKHSEIFDKNVAGKETYAKVILLARPNKRGMGNIFTNKVAKKDIIPSEILEAIEEGVFSTLRTGIVMGYEAIDIEIELLEADYDELCSTAFAFEAAVAMGLDTLLRKCDPVVLEPVMALDVEVPSDFVGEVMSSITQRSGLVNGVEMRGANMQLIKAQAPLVQMFGYTTVLRSQTQGRGSFSMGFDHFEIKSR